ncbi:MAG: hypothetical protein IJD02_05860 [Lachnospiraceae bacterium]|nr:hypothetical protein [Lachnospiraceae bacterium]
MKRNIFSVIVIVLLVVDLVFTAIMLFAVLPNTTKTNDLIAKVAAAIELEMEEENTDISIYDLEAYSFEEGDLFISLKKDTTDKKDRYAIIKGVTIHLNTSVKDFDSVKEVVISNDNKMKDIITTVYSEYTKEEAQLQKDRIKAEILLEFEELFESKIVHDISFGNLAFQ